MLLSNRWLVLEGDLVVNLIVWDGNDWSPAKGQTVMREPDGVPVTVGWRLVDGEWIEPDNIVYIPPPDPEQ